MQLAREQAERRWTGRRGGLGRGKGGGERTAERLSIWLASYLALVMSSSSLPALTSNSGRSCASSGPCQRPARFTRPHKTAQALRAVRWRGGSGARGGGAAEPRH